ncbi:chemotaxis protein CheA [Sphingomonas paeninsulae]|uniref:Chemotaxis protein CheA n=1 Tax=Sphingomonas paeninsulae TaxID=2319844 RepID=A0A494TJ77_SPHPE|nr:chemotaxis protein CheW [Sphingomonas paeninsulae]AYJ87554.1 chemotaxis protein CheA [Sphingomonas paeninsulae]
MDDLTQEFVAETREMLEHVSNALLDWERNPTAVRDFDDIFRFFHTVKGSCGFLDLPRIEKLAHAAESVLGDLRSGKRNSDAVLVGGLLRVIDRIMVLTSALETGNSAPDEAADAAFLTALETGVAPETFYASAPVTRRRNVRIDIDLLDAMMTQVSDLVLVRNELIRSLRPTLGADATASLLDALSARIGELRGSIARARMQPVDRLFAALPRLVRDTASELGKSVRLVIEGTDVELDREMVEQLRDPLIHIVRNAIDHGVESAERRMAVGKPVEAELRVTARQTGNQVVIAISDDGKGIDIDRLRARAVAIGLRGANLLSPEAAANLIFQPGLSTADAVTAISGRGVGMDVVRANIEKLGGNVSLVNRMGAGLTIDICVPLTLSIVTVLTVSAGGMTFAVPRAIVQEVLSIRSEAVRIERLGSGHIATIRGEKLGTLSLASVLERDEGDQTHLLIVQPTGGQRYGLLVEAVHDQEEVVVRQVAPRLATTGVFAGQALPNSGLPILVIDVLGVARRAGLNVDRAEAVVAAVTPVALPTISVLSFIGLDGQLWGVRTALVERIEDVPRRAFTVRAGDAFVTLDGLLSPVVLDGALPATDEIALLRLNDGKSRLGYPVLQIEDLVRIDEASVLSSDRNPIAVVDGEVIQLLDENILFSGVTPKRKAASHAI